MRRTVILPVDDDRAAQIDAYLVGGDGADLTKMLKFPVPPDDQLTRDLEGACAYMEHGARILRREARHRGAHRSTFWYGATAQATELEHRVERLRAAAGLDEDAS